MGKGKVVKVSGIERASRTATVLLRGSNKMVLEEAERSLHDALCVIRCLVHKRFLIAGGAAPEVQVAFQLQRWAKTLVVRLHSCSDLQPLGIDFQVIRCLLVETFAVRRCATMPWIFQNMLQLFTTQASKECVPFWRTLRTCLLLFGKSCNDLDKGLAVLAGRGTAACEAGLTICSVLAPPDSFQFLWRPCGGCMPACFSSQAEARAGHPQRCFQPYQVLKAARTLDMLSFSKRVSQHVMLSGRLEDAITESCPGLCKVPWLMLSVRTCQQTFCAVMSASMLFPTRTRAVMNASALLPTEEVVRRAWRHTACARLQRRWR